MNPSALSAKNGELEGCSFSKSSCFTLARALSEFLYIFQFLTSRWGGLSFPPVHIPSLRIVWKIQMLLMCGL